MVLNWRNHPDIRKWMRSSDPIDAQQHQKFLTSLRQTDTKQYYLLYLDHQPLGVTDFYNENNTSGRRSSYYGYYLNPELIGASYGMLLEFWAAEIALVSMGIQQLIAETKCDNQSANELHAHFGFTIRQTNADGLQEAVLERKTWETRRLSIHPLINRWFT